MRTRYSVRTSSLPDVVGNASERSPLGGPLKRAFDVAVGGMVLITLTPILLVTAGLIRLVLGRPVIVAEDRVGYKGRTFKCYAFRTTERKTDCVGADLGQWPHFQGMFSANGFGQALRTSGLDELPRLFNVVRGDMSLI